jgi:predicted Zn-dependent protease
MSTAFLQQEYFEQLAHNLISSLQSGEHLFVSLQAEKSHFVRWTQSKVRQTGLVEDATLELTYVLDRAEGRRSMQWQFQLTGLPNEDRTRARYALDTLRTEALTLPLDPFAVLPENTTATVTQAQARLFDPGEAIEILARPLAGLDLAGIYSSGPIVRALATSAGQRAWFSTELMSFDFSLYTAEQKAVKRTWSDPNGSEASYAALLESARLELEMLKKPNRKVPPGEYRAYLPPSAVAEILPTLNWSGFSEAAHRQGQSGLRKLKEGQHLSPLFSLNEDFSNGRTPRFTGLGEIAPERLEVIRKGELVNTLVCARTAQEYGVPSNGATPSETLRAPVIEPGTLDERQALSRLGTGLYLSHLHYLNWSDRNEGSLTGLTRYACFWVENGQIQAPLETLRWDDSVYRFFGTELEALTSEAQAAPDVSTYQTRALGGATSPGALLRSFRVRS